MGKVRKSTVKKKVYLGGIMGMMLMVAVGMEGYKYYQTNQPKGIAMLGVLDGDTITVEGKTRFRLRNIDAPEVDYCGGKEAKEKLEKLLKGKRIRIEEEIIDKWGRPMGLVYVGEKLINLEMIKSGWAKYHSDETTPREKIKLINDQNKLNKIGIYGKCWQTENKENPKCNIKGNIDPDNSSTRIYQMPGCVQYNTTIVELDRGEGWYCSEKEVVAAGFVKSKRCE